MKHLRAHELEPTTKPEHHLKKTRDRIVATTTNPNLIAVMMFGVIGCLIVANLIFRFPELGLTVEQLNPFVGP
jgi:hypothetical protein